MDQEFIEYWHHPVAQGIELSRAQFEHFSFERHVHLDYHIGIVSQGAQSYHHKGSHYRLGPGMLSTLNPDEAHDGNRDGSQAYIAKVMSIPYELITSIAKELGTNECFFKQPLISSPELCLAFSELHDGLGFQRHLNDDLDLETRLMAITTELVLRNASQLSPLLNQPAHGLSVNQVNTIKQKFIDQPEQNFQLDELADDIGLSKFQLLRQFKQAVGMTPHAYQKRIRLEQAKKAIWQGQSISTIAHDVGFFDQSHFNKAFKRAFLVTPSQFQKRVL